MSSCRCLPSPASGGRLPTQWRAPFGDAAVGSARGGSLQDYLGYLTSTALCLALALPLAAGAAAGRRWRGASLRSLWLFGLVPLAKASPATRSSTPGPAEPRWRRSR